MIEVAICTQGGWRYFKLHVTDKDISDCYAMPSAADRIAFWQKRSGTKLPAGHVVIWKILGP